MIDNTNNEVDADFLALKLKPPTVEQSNFLRKTFGLEKVKPFENI